MEAYLIRAATKADVKEITALANNYVFEKLTGNDREAGFLTGRFEEPAMEQMITSATSFVAVYQESIVGFVINSTLSPKDYPPLVTTMIRQFPELTYQNLPLTSYNYFFYGPVLVSKAHRGKKLLHRMFNQTRESLCSQYNLGVAFVHAQNKNSLRIHTESFGMEIIGQFTFNYASYFILVFPV